MNPNAEAIRKLLLAHFGGDEGVFRTAAWELVEGERQANRAVYAAELERILSAANVPRPGRKSTMTPLPSLNGSVPKDKERNAPLIEASDPRRCLDDLILSPAVREPLTRVVDEWRKADALRAHGLSPANKVLFCGPPGCGKSVAAEALAKELYLPLATVRFDAVVSSYLGETASNLRKVFDYARSRPMILFFDEFDAIGKLRTAEDEHGELKRVVNSFLQLLDGFRSDTLTVAATNHQGVLDPALWRRFDVVARFPLPERGEIEELLARHFRQLPVSRAVRLADIARTVDGASHADVERLAVEAVKRAILSGRDQVEPEVLRAAVAGYLSRAEISREGRPGADAPRKKPARRKKRTE